ncbi:MAG: GNAT family N-acetyltransferase [Desulfomonilaceae bacterium]
MSSTLKKVRVPYHEPDLHRNAFENSHTAVFVYDGDKLVGFGRAISDDDYQAALYDMDVVPECQRQGIGTTITAQILDRVRHCNVVLYAAVSKESFYEKMGFRRMKTRKAIIPSLARVSFRATAIPRAITVRITFAFIFVLPW